MCAWLNLVTVISTGCGCLDRNLNGGVQYESVTLIYGEPETGKTTLAMQCAVSCAMQGFKTLFLDSDGTFSAERLSQVSAGNFEEIAPRIILMRPNDFKEQAAVIDRLPDYTAKTFGLVIIDAVTSLYRVQIAEVSGKAFDLNRELNRQMAVLAETAKTRKLSIIVTSQVRSIFNEPYVSVAPVATRVVKFWAETIIALKPTENPQIIKAVIEKASGKPQEATCYLRITEAGIHDYPLY